MAFGQGEADLIQIGYNFIRIYCVRRNIRRYISIDDCRGGQRGRAVGTGSEIA